MSDLRKLRVDQIGSLCSPPALQAVFARYKQGLVDEAELDRAKDDAIRAVVTRQARIGLPVVTDGELRRRNFQESFGSSVRGFEEATEDRALEGVNTAPLSRAEQNFSAPGPAIVTRRKVVERLALARNVPLAEYQFTAALTDRPIKATVLSPDRISQRFDWQNSLAVYRDMDAFMVDVIAITRTIVAELVEAGCRYIQVDAPGYTAYVDQVSLDRMRARRGPPAQSRAFDRRRQCGDRRL
jgi:5-methyltetrahydropteroyltriglutamate--homocysteine methyltransferase